jgi:hypothetical protein
MARTAGLKRADSLTLDGSARIGESSIGAFLLMALDAQELVAAIALALARRHKKAAGQSWVDAAFVTLGRWRSIFKEDTFDGQRVAMRTSASATIVVEASRRDADPLGGLLENVLTRLDVVPRTIESALLQQSEVSRQIARYAADRAACEAAGSAAMLSLLAKMRWDFVLEGAADNALRQGLKQADGLFGAVQERVRTLSTREQERIRRSALLEDQTIEAGELPMGRRMQAIHDQSLAPSVKLENDEFARVMDELKPDISDWARRRWEALR